MSAPIAPIASGASAAAVSPSSTGAARPSGASFTDLLTSAIDKLDNQMATADQLAMRLAAGDDVDVHQVMVAMETASIGLETAIQIRNKAVEAYKEIMGMPL